MMSTHKLVRTATALRPRIQFLLSGKSRVFDTRHYCAICSNIAKSAKTVSNEATQPRAPVINKISQPETELKKQTKMSVDRVILPTNVKPIKYHLTLEPDLDNFTFRGEERVELQVNADSNTITLNANELEIQSAQVTQGEKKLSGEITYDKENEYAIFTFPEPVTKGQTAILELHFTGLLNDKMSGFYRSKYQLNGEDRYMATTQFEATDARKAFPCWDEPAIKSIFEVSLIAPKDRTALSNMDVTSETLTSNDKKLVKFSPSPIMSTYLLAFIIGDFDYVEQKASNDVLIRVYVPKGKKEQGTFGLDVAVKVLPLLEEYFGQKYPLTKLDLAAIPDFAAGAMENWGLITYRETALLIDPIQSSSHSKQWVALVVAHEISHQWFGNLVTMEWWDDLWLNEGFATWVEYFAVDQLYPEWNIFEQFVHDDFGRAQSLDALKSSHPIQVPIRIAAEVDEIFDAISYSKGCAVIRMLVEHLGVDSFRKGLLHYLNQHKYSNASTNDLWNALSESNGNDLDVSTMMSTWTLQTGYPVLRLQHDSTTNQITITQMRYLDQGIEESDSSMWHIPIKYITDSGDGQPLVMTDRSITLQLNHDFKWFKLNPGQSGFYRVLYPDHFYDQLCDAIRSKSIGAIDRLGIQEDVFNLAKAGLISMKQVLNVLSAYTLEDNYTVLNSVSANCSQLYNLIKSDHDLLILFERFCNRLFVNQFELLGWKPRPDESHLTSMMRSLVISNLSKYNHKETIQHGLEIYPKNGEMELLDEVCVPDLRSSLYSINIKNSDEAYHQVLNRYGSIDLNEEKIRCLKSLGSTRNVTLLEKTLEMCGSVKSQDAFYVLSGVVDNPLGSALGWQYLKSNYEEIKNRYDGGWLFNRMIKVATQSLTTNQDANDVEEFFADKTTPSIKRTVAQCLETVRLNAKWYENSKADLKQWLESNQ
ncbi:puromycin-sensitive aminopeptidase [Acrasis kona]|uniref:Aminopeptidase n=1 Tax=Acrasis kona TaxID=1008807 RepID=A0AAW2YYB4_9EUKA